MTLYTVSRKGTAQEGERPLAELFGNVSDAEIVSNAVPYMATLDVADDAMDIVKTIVEKENLSLSPFRGVQLN